MDEETLGPINSVMVSLFLGISKAEKYGPDALVGSEHFKSSCLMAARRPILRAVKDGGPKAKEKDGRRRTSRQRTEQKQ